MKKLLSVFFLAAMIPALSQRARADNSDDRIIIYEMKDDPTLARFVGDTAAKGFYALEIDELHGDAAILYRNADVLYRANVDVSIKGQKLILKYRKRQKTFLRDERTSAAGKKEEIVYPIECPPEKGGWRHGASFGRRLIRRKDESAERLTAGDAYLEFQLAVARCAGSPEECGTPGCPEWETIASSATTVASVPGAPTPPGAPATKIPLSKALLEGQLSESDILSQYGSDINLVLPAKVKELTATTTGYHVTNLPYGGVMDPALEQRGFRIGVLTRTYVPDDKTEAVTVEVEPLLAEFQDPQPTKCGSWPPLDNRTVFTVVGHPALYTQIPATGYTKETALLVVCGKTVSVSVQVQAYRSKEDMAVIFSNFPLDQMDRVAGTDKQ